MSDQVNLQARMSSPHASLSIVRVLRWYEKNGDRLVGETTLDTMNLAELQGLFRESADNLMVDSYSVSDAQVERIQREISELIDLSAYDYYLECDAVWSFED